MVRNRERGAYIIEDLLDGGGSMGDGESEMKEVD